MADIPVSSATATSPGTAVTVNVRDLLPPMSALRLREDENLAKLTAPGTCATTNRYAT
jgi:hypothetical protein